MNIKALITTLGILGSSSVAMARPVTVSASAEASWSFGTSTSRPVVRDHRYYTPAPAPVVVQPVRIRNEQDYRWNDHSSNWGYQPRAQLLASGLMFNSGEYRKDIVLEGRGRFSTVLLDSNGGSTFIKEVRIEFIGGGVQSIPVNRYLRGTQSMTFDLDGEHRAINRIFVYRADGNNMDLRRASQGEFTVSAL